LLASGPITGQRRSRLRDLSPALAPFKLARHLEGQLGATDLLWRFSLSWEWVDSYLEFRFHSWLDKPTMDGLCRFAAFRDTKAKFLTSIPQREEMFRRTTWHALNLMSLAFG
jgi:hypothetical protein